MFRQGSDRDLAAITQVKALLTARDILLEELQKLSKAIDQRVDDLIDVYSKFSGSKMIDSFLRSDWGIVKAEGSEEKVGRPELANNSPNGFQEKSNRTVDFGCGCERVLQDLPEEDLIPMQTSLSRAELHRRSIGQMKINNRSIQDMQIFADPLHIPVIIVEQHVMNPTPCTPSSNFSHPFDQKETSVDSIGYGGKVRTNSLGAAMQKSGRVLRAVIFVHGFQACGLPVDAKRGLLTYFPKFNCLLLLLYLQKETFRIQRKGHHLDLRLVRNQWLLIDPGAECLMSEANEDKTSGDFREMGARLAEEVTSFVKRKMDRASRSGGYKNIKISFVGHSIGNVIIRCALTETVMAPYLKYLYTYMSVSGPHLGYLYSSNSLFNSGMWLLKKLKGSPCIHQLTFTDDADIQNTFFYKLCKDGYVPYHSARIELCSASSYDYSKKGQIFMEMLNDCLDQIRAPLSETRTFIRCDVNFDTSNQGRNLNTIIGRAAHIEFLEIDIFAKFIMWSFMEFFR
ncbi:hypothetical protein ACLOJK_030240 [Asimina triloba]